MLWALGWSRGFGPIGSDGPTHAMTRSCDLTFDAALLLGGGGLVLWVLAFFLIARAMNRGGWWQTGLWTGFILIADALLIFQYLRFLVALVGCVD